MCPGPGPDAPRDERAAAGGDPARKIIDKRVSKLTSGTSTVNLVPHRRNRYCWLATIRQETP